MLITTYAFIHKPGPRINPLWPDFWYMQIKRLGILTHLRNGTPAKDFYGFRRSALYTNAEQVEAQVEKLHQGKRNSYLCLD